MDCTQPSVNLCSRSECVHSTITFEGADRKPHLPAHGMFKVHRFVFDRDMGRIERTARDTLKFARETVFQLKEERSPMPMCLRCKALVSLPCWCCVECTGEWEPGNEPPSRYDYPQPLCTAGEKFICDDCEHKQPPFNKTHTGMHTIVRVSEDAKKELSSEGRLQLVEDELVKMRQALAGMTQNLAGVTQNLAGVTQSLAGVTQTLEKLVEKVSK